MASDLLGRRHTQVGEVQMDVKREIQALIEGGLKFSIEMTGGPIRLWVGDYARDATAVATVASLEQAVEWLQRHGQFAGPSQA